MDKELDKESLRKIKEALPSNYSKLIRAKTGLSYSSIYKTFNPDDELFVERVVDAALEVIEEVKQRKIDRDKRINNLI